MRQPLLALFCLVSLAHAEISDPNFRGVEFSKEKGLSDWKDAKQRTSWFGEIKTPGKLTASLRVKGFEGRVLSLNVGETSCEAVVTNGAASFGEFEIAKACYAKFELISKDGCKGLIEALVLDGPATTDAHFNIEPRRNATAFRDMIDNMCHGGKIAMLGIPSEPIAIDWNKVIFNMLTIHGIYGREMYETWYQMSVMLENGVNIAPIITHRFHYTDFEQGFAAMESGNCGKVVLDWTT